MNPSPRAASSLPNHPACWMAAARDAAWVSTACPKCRGFVDVSYDPGARPTRTPTGARHRTVTLPDEGLGLEMQAPVEDSPWKGARKGPDTTVTIDAVDLSRDDDPLPQRRIFRRCWACGWGALLFPKPQTDTRSAPSVPWRTRGRAFLHGEQRWVTRAELARKAGLSPSYLSEVLAGTKRPSAQALERLVATSGIDPWTVLGPAIDPLTSRVDWLGFLEAQARGLLDADTDAARTGLVTSRTERVRLPVHPRRRHPAIIYRAPGAPALVLATRAAQRAWAQHWDATWTHRISKVPTAEASLWGIADEAHMPTPWEGIQADSVWRFLDVRWPRGGAPGALRRHPTTRRSP